MDNRYFLRSACLTLLIVPLLMFSGCTSSTPTDNSSSVSAPSVVTPHQNSSSVSQQTAATIMATATSVATTVAHLSHGVTLSYPSVWEIQELSETEPRDYGRNTTNIANFFSPDTPGLTMATNPDGHPYTTVSIDVDPNPVSDNDRYFNLATAALENKYGSIEITHHMQTGSFNRIEECSGCKDYNLEFKTKTVERWYHFSSVDGRFYIITINNPSLNNDEVYNMLKSTKIVLPTSTQKARS
jgi:hypothetical protein